MLEIVKKEFSLSSWLTEDLENVVAIRRKLYPLLQDLIEVLEIH